MQLHFEHAVNEITIAASAHAGGWRVELPSGGIYDVVAYKSRGLVRALRAARATESTPSGVERVLRVPVARDGQSVVISWAGHVYRFSPRVPGAPRAGADDDGSAVTAPAGGVLVELAVSLGDPIAAGQRVGVIEAMKVMTPVESSRAGRVSDVLVAAGQRVEQGALIVRIETESPSSPDGGSE